MSLIVEKAGPSEKCSDWLIFTYTWTVWVLSSCRDSCSPSQWRNVHNTQKPLNKFKTVSRSVQFITAYLLLSLRSPDASLDVTGAHHSMAAPHTIHTDQKLLLIISQLVHLLFFDFCPKSKVELLLQDDLTFKGVVFNEMKGVYSSADSANMRAVQRALFPDNTYAVDSGGDPTVIPELSYDEFRSFHGRYYHPSNARFWFYGDDDPIERLRILDGYLSEFDSKAVDSTVHPQPLFTVSHWFFLLTYNLYTLLLRMCLSLFTNAPQLSRLHKLSFSMVLYV